MDIRCPSEIWGRGEHDDELAVLNGEELGWEGQNGPDDY